MRALAPPTRTSPVLLRALCLGAAFALSVGCRVGAEKRLDVAEPPGAREAPASTAPAAQSSAPGETAAATQAPAGAAAPAEDTRALRAEDRGLDVRGSLSSRLRLRTSGDAHDADLYEVLALDVGDAQKDGFSAHVLGRMTADLDGHDDDSDAVFPSLQDADDEAVQFDLYEAYADLSQAFGAPIDLRIGRQYDAYTPEYAQFDGVRAALAPAGTMKFVAGVYGGIPVRIYEDYASGDFLGGAWCEARPWEGGRARLDWMHVDQDEDEAGDFSDDLLGLALWQRLGERVLLDGGVTTLDSEGRDLRLRATYDDGDWTVRASWYRLLEEQEAHAYEFDPFYSQLQSLSPYDQLQLLVSKGVLEWLRVDLGGDLRRLDDGGDEGAYNHDYDRGYATLAFLDVLAEGLSLSLTGDTWQSDDQDVDSWGFDVTWEGGPGWRLSAGSAYSMYRYDILNDRESDDVRVWYGRLQKQLSASWSLDLRYEYEDDDEDDYHLFDAGATWHF